MALDFKEIKTVLKQVHDEICEGFNELTGITFQEDVWSYEQGEGGGCSRIYMDGPVTKGGINYSAISGDRLPKASLAHKIEGNTVEHYSATGISIVIHPKHPRIPTMHMNVRYLENGDKRWFGGGIDCTPHYPCYEEAIQFHTALQSLCESFDFDYDAFKKTCDEYFYIPHRKEHRGIGGIFFDNQYDAENPRRILNFITTLARAFPRLYTPFWNTPASLAPIDPKDIPFQLIRRGRYVEFNLVYDRGTKFGLQSGGRAESILMSLPLEAHWPYNYQPTAEEAAFIAFYLSPQDWVHLPTSPASTPS